MVGVITDGAPAMVGRDKSLVRLCRKDESFTLFLCYHCIINQQALCGHFIKLNNAMKLVVNIVNKIRAQALQRRLFKTLADEIDLTYGNYFFTLKSDEELNEPKLQLQERDKELAEMISDIKAIHTEKCILKLGKLLV
ncbi:unnamed protein product [Acanthoscelides obtectus]|uniref:Uncharacterized protein n=1 Tax=Acanthoscelides obtectus TaxID=200917 RepID=A0A9P0KXW8_ACAOB|nr:unnamed protein product [Acanthoscelides obtectus]CAK1656707.1 General transcription factor II-I repeat domain-containing protein 2 [Acanthoscelides obtectus]